MLKSIFITLSISLLAIGFAACDGSTATGTMGGPCFDDGSCDGDLVCNTELICDQAPAEDLCENVDCGTNGSCVVQAAVAVCICDAGYEGEHCETDIDECADAPCQNGGSCTDGVNSYTCECPTGFDGEQCENNIDDCADVTCQNGGSCVDGVNSYTCDCLPGYDGDQCENNIDDCADVTCQNGGTCTDGVNSYTCDCLPGYDGDQCENNIDDCADAPCRNGGTCTDGVSSYSCECPDPFWGDDCEFCTDGLAFEGVCQHPRIFVSDWQGSADFGGPAAADAICNTDANSPDNTKSYKALLGLSGVRELGNDWPLAPNATYYRVDGSTVIDTTNENGVFVFDLQNSIWETSPEVWTGLNTNFATSSKNCSNWTSISGTVNVGGAGWKSNRAIYRYTQYCNRTNVRLYCVEQVCDAGYSYDTSNDVCIED